MRYIKPKAKQFVSYLSQKNINRSINNNVLKLILQDVDKKGNAIDIFMQNFAMNAKVRGVNLCLVDMPKEKAPNLKEQIEK
ncbi:MAG: hypothetical protein Q9M43_10655 [Sulfurimonas sp.]|nr:hypothetical protein [Sulfurimonas sp.]